MRHGHCRSIAPHFGERHAVFLDCHPRMGITFRDGAVEGLPVAQAHIVKRRLVDDNRPARAPCGAALPSPPCPSASGSRRWRACRACAATAATNRAFAIALSRTVRSTSPVTSEAMIGPDIARAHHIDRQIVHHAAVDQQMAVMGDRRQDARQRHAGAQRPPQRPGAMHMDAPGGEIRRNAEERLGQFLDAHVAEIVAQQMSRLCLPRTSAISGRV